MASYTENLNLLKKDPVADGADTFNIETMLNENWDKIDEAKGEIDAALSNKADKGPPQEYDLPLAEGITNINGTTSRYWKSQDSTVHVEISVKSASELPYESLIATLPSGFIPQSNQPRLATNAAFVTVLTTGEIKLFSGNGETLQPNQWICVEFNYVTNP